MRLFQRINLHILFLILLQVVNCQHNFSFLNTAKNWADIEAGFTEQAQTPEPVLLFSPASSVLLAPQNILIDEENERKANLVRFFLYTDYSTRFSPDELYYDDYSSLMSSKFNKTIPVKFFIHGFGHHYNCSFPQRVKDIYINEGRRMSTKRINIITVDWGALSMDSTKTDPMAALSNYKAAVDHVTIVGRRVGEFVNFLYQNRATNLTKVHLVGFSLGAHVAGLAGQHIYRTWFQKIGRITGLDPAGPLFMTGSIGRHLSDEDAHFVDFVHTDRGQCGTLKSIGHANFFVNGGFAPQPGCLGSVLTSTISGKLSSFKSDFLNMIPLVLSGSCSHNQAPIFYSQSIFEDDIKAQKCFSYMAFETGLCFLRSSVNFGDMCHGGIKGDFYLNMDPSKANVLTQYNCR